MTVTGGEKRKGAKEYLNNGLKPAEVRRNVV
jgi:hypothetical protein